MIDLKLHGRVGVLTMQHGKANAMDAAFCEDILKRLDELRTLPAGAIVITGQGGIFSAGVDLVRALDGGPVGTVVHPRPTRLSSRKLWIAFARGSAGRIGVDDGARRALMDSGRSLLAAGVRNVEGGFTADDAVEVVGPDGRPFAKGLVRYDAPALRDVAGLRSTQLPEGSPAEVIHRDDLVMLP